MKRLQNLVVLVLLLLSFSGVREVFAQSPTCIPLLPQPWYLSGNNGASEAYQGISADALQGKDTLQITYDLHGLQALPGDASAIIFDQNGWRYISLSNYGQNGLNGVQTVQVPLSHFQENGNYLDGSQVVGTLHVRFWSQDSFNVDIYDIQACGTGSIPPTNTPPPTLTPIPMLTASHTASPIPTLEPTFTPFPTATTVPTSTPLPLPTLTPTASVVIPPLPSGGVELLTQPWRLQGNNGDSQQYQAIPSNVLIGKDTLRITYNLNGLAPLGGDASAIIFNQNGWRYISLSNYGQNGLNGVQTVDIPLSHFQENGNYLNLTQPVGTLQARFWYSSAFVVDIYSIVVFSAATPPVSPTNTPTATNTLTSTPIPPTAIPVTQIPTMIPVGNPGSNQWAVSNAVSLCQRTEIREGSSNSSKLRIVTQGVVGAVVIDGPRNTEGSLWWDIRLDSGATGWVRADMADCRYFGPLPNVWQLDGLVFLCEGTMIREGSANISKLRDIVRDSRWVVRVIDGPREWDGTTWYDIRTDFGLTGWVRRDQADCQGGWNVPNVWVRDGMVLLCEGTQIREGSGNNYALRRTVSGSRWLVRVIDGPRETDGTTWWDVRVSDGGTGWLRQDQADNCGGSQSTGSQPLPPRNNWAINNRVYLCLNTQIRSGSSLSYPVHTTVPVSNWEVIVIGGPRSADGYTWWDISRADGGTGWVRQDQADCLNLAPQPTPTTQYLVTATQTPDTGFRTVVFNTPAYIIDLRINELNPDMCVVENGAQLIVNELQSFNNQLLNAGATWTSQFWDYFLPNSGGVEQLRHRIESTISQANPVCSGKLWFGIGNRLMDTSGLGNLAFGYFMTTWTAPELENFISNVAQWANEHTQAQIRSECNSDRVCFITRLLQQADNPDDRKQREVGRVFAEANLRGEPLDAPTLARYADQFGLY